MQLFINNWASRLASPLASSALAMQIPAEDAAQLVGLGTGDHYLLTLVAVDGAGVETAHEIVRVTGAAGSVLTIVRAQEGTVAADWPISTPIEARLTAGGLSTIRDAAEAAVQSGELAAVATSGAYADLTGKPTIPSTPAEVGAATAAQGAKADTAVQPGSLAAVATSGAYSDLTGKPAIPSTAGDVGAIPSSEKGAALGVATLDAGSKIPLAQLPAAAITDTFVVNTEAAMLALSAQVGDVAIRPDVTSSFILQAEPASVLGNWQQIITPSIGGGAPAGSATPQALGSASPGVSGSASREDHVHPMPSASDVGAATAGHSHSDATTGSPGFMSAADKTKLDGVATGATANATDAQLRDRGTHTGSQAISTVAGLQAALDGKASTAQAKQSIIIACSDETTALAAGAGKVTFRMPYAFTLTGVRASLVTAQTSGSIITVDINEAGASILSTKLTIDNGEKTSTTAATAAVISDTSLADDAEITIDIDQIGDGTAKGLKVTLIGVPA